MAKCQPRGWTANVAGLQKPKFATSSKTPKFLYQTYMKSTTFCRSVAWGLSNAFATPALPNVTSEVVVRSAYCNFGGCVAICARNRRGCVAIPLWQPPRLACACPNATSEVEALRWVEATSGVVAEDFGRGRWPRTLVEDSGRALWPRSLGSENLILQHAQKR